MNQEEFDINGDTINNLGKRICSYISQTEIPDDLWQDLEDYNSYIWYNLITVYEETTGIKPVFSWDMCSYTRTYLNYDADELKKCLGDYEILLGIATNFRYFEQVADLMKDYSTTYGERLERILIAYRASILFLDHAFFLKNENKYYDYKKLIQI